MSETQDGYRLLQEFVTGSFGVVIPKQHIVDLQWRAGDLVKFHRDGNKIIIEKLTG